jgi:hypothetical protein
VMKQHPMISYNYQLQGQEKSDLAKLFFSFHLF